MVLSKLNGQVSSPVMLAKSGWRKILHILKKKSFILKELVADKVEVFYYDYDLIFNIVTF